MSLLFSPLTIAGTTFKNRAWISPMCQYSATNGVVGQWHDVHYGSFATSGAGLVMSEATAVSPEGRISIVCPGIWNDAQEAAWKKNVEVIHGQGGLVGIQLAHAGRKASSFIPWGDHAIASREEGGWQPVAPSPIAFDGYEIPHELSKEEIGRIVSDFTQAACRSLDAGFDVLEIHAAHGYLIHEFLSPLSNLRTDEYGGSFENRIRLLLEIVAAVKAELAARTPLFVRISATDWVEGGWDLNQAISLTKELKILGVDLIDVSSGGLDPRQQIELKPGYQVHFSKAIRSEAGIATSAVGLITSGPQAEQILESGEADAVMIGRAALRNPRWALQAAEELGEVVPWPLPLERGRTVR